MEFLWLKRCFCCVLTIIWTLYGLKVVWMCECAVAYIHWIWFYCPLGRRRTRQRKIGNSGSRTELPNLNDHEAVQRYFNPLLFFYWFLYSKLELFANHVRNCSSSWNNKRNYNYVKTTSFPVILRLWLWIDKRNQLKKTIIQCENFLTFFIWWVNC